MRLTCPNCGAVYEIAEAMVPVAGRHVQCTACHTRWFVRGEVAKEESEDDIVQRLEARSHLRPVPTPVREVAPEPAPFPRSQRSDPASSVGTPPSQPPDKAPDALAPQREPERPGVPAPDRKPVSPTQPRPVAAGPQGPRAVPAKPAGRPMQPGEGPSLRPAPRLDLGVDSGRQSAAPAPAPTRFWRGVAVVLVVFGLALAAYVWRIELATRVPAAAPAINAYGQSIDTLRLELEQHIERLRGAR